MKFDDMNRTDIENALPGILAKCGVGGMVDAPTIVTWMTDLDEKGRFPYMTMIGGLVDQDFIQNEDIMGDLLGALIRLRQTTPCPYLDGAIPEEELRKKGFPDSVPIEHHDIAIPPKEWWDTYLDAMEHMHTKRYSEAAKLFDATFSHLENTRTTWREIYRLYCNAGITYLLNGDVGPGAVCLEMAAVLNPKYEFGMEQLQKYRDGGFNAQIQLGIVRKIGEGLKKWQERPEHLDLDVVMTWPVKKVLAKLSGFGVVVNRDEFVQWAKEVDHPERLAEEHLYPMASIPPDEEDFIWIAAYTLWSIYCPDEPSHVMLNTIIGKAFSDLGECSIEELPEDPESNDNHELHLSRIETQVLSDKEDFLERWAHTFAYVNGSREWLKHILANFGVLPQYRDRVERVLSQLETHITHPDWGGARIIIAIRTGDPTWKDLYSMLRKEYPYYSSIAVDAAFAFEVRDDPGLAEQYLLEGLGIVDSRAEDGISSLDEDPSTILGDYEFILDRLELHYEDRDSEEEKFDFVEAKRRSIEEQSDTLSDPVKSEAIETFFKDGFTAIQQHLTSESPAMKYFQYLEQYGIDFETEELVQSDVSEIQFTGRDFKLPGISKRKKRTGGKKKKKRREAKRKLGSGKRNQ